MLFLKLFPMIFTALRTNYGFEIFYFANIHKYNTYIQKKTTQLDEVDVTVSPFRAYAL